MFQLPSEMIHEIASHLNYLDIVSLQVCQYFRDVLVDWIAGDNRTLLRPEKLVEFINPGTEKWYNFYDIMVKYAPLDKLQNSLRYYGNCWYDEDIGADIIMRSAPDDLERFKLWSKDVGYYHATSSRLLLLTYENSKYADFFEYICRWCIRQYPEMYLDECSMSTIFNKKYYKLLDIIIHGGHFGLENIYDYSPPLDIVMYLLENHIHPNWLVMKIAVRFPDDTNIIMQYISDSSNDLSEDF